MTQIDSEHRYLEEYNIHDYDVPLTTVDSVLFTIKEDVLNILLVQRNHHPDKNLWSLPGGFIDLAQDNSIEACANRKLEEKTGVKPPYLEQLSAIGGPARDKRGWSITICYYALISHTQCFTQHQNIKDVKWCPLGEALNLNLAFDHHTIIINAAERLKQKALYSIVPAFALPEEFTLAQLQRLHEIILDKDIQKKSFRRRIEQANVLEDTGKMTSESVGRPAKLYRAKEETAHFRFVRNLEL